MHSLYNYKDRKITIVPNGGYLFTVSSKYFLDGREYRCRTSDIGFIETLIRANKCQDKTNQFDFYTINSEIIYIDFVVDDDTTIYQAPISASLYHKIMNKILYCDEIYCDFTISFILSNEIDYNSIHIVDTTITSDYKYEILEHNSVLIDVLITCRDYIEGSGEMIGKMRSAIIADIIG